MLLYIRILLFWKKRIYKIRRIYNKKLSNNNYRGNTDGGLLYERFREPL